MMTRIMHLAPDGDLSEKGHDSASLCRLTRRSQFLDVARDGRKNRSRALTVQVMTRNEGCPGLRVGLTASRHVGTATERNRIKRRLRSATSQAYAAADLQADIVVVARREVLSEPFGRLVGALRRAAGLVPPTGGAVRREIASGPVAPMPSTP